MYIIWLNKETGECGIEQDFGMPGQLDFLKSIDKKKSFSFLKASVRDVVFTMLDQIEGFGLKIDGDDAKKIKIEKALDVSNNIQKEAAKLLGISPRQMCHYCKQYGIRRPGWPARRKIKNLHVLKKAS